MQLEPAPGNSTHRVHGSDEFQVTCLSKMGPLIFHELDRRLLPRRDKRSFISEFTGFLTKAVSSSSSRRYARRERSRASTISSVSKTAKLSSTGTRFRVFQPPPTGRMKTENSKRRTERRKLKSPNRQPPHTQDHGFSYLHNRGKTLFRAMNALFDWAVTFPKTGESFRREPRRGQTIFKQPRTYPDKRWLPISPRSGSENRNFASWNLVQNLVQLVAEKAPITPIRSCLLR